jgi:UDP-N-acetylmuramate: L-alanyl-gamma-D-glutamyl-meso-diaminopimelate ligase
VALEEVLEKGCWSEVERFGAGAAIDVQLLNEDGSHFAVLENGTRVGEVRWGQTGLHSVKNGVAALLAARHVGVSLAQGCELLGGFLGVKRRMELVGEVSDIRIYDDFAHHPTAIATTLQGLRKKVGKEKIVAVIEPRSNTMRMGAHRDKLADSVLAADEVIWYQPEGISWSLDDVVRASKVPAKTLSSIDAVIADICSRDATPLNVVIMSNGGFGGVHRKLVQALQGR